ncbi:hypothetical protein QFC20_000547 [Naganishia adeliensis]|uniref:Uncharacterized protein n=1 Tax=Naganishia adeliensis TaxID=92952 RepID=A0ACC2WZM8_9TREE|nr:hypothetical protein QFC20_000547 [Naganishia adeliensis]
MGIFPHRRPAFTSETPSTTSLGAASNPFADPGVTDVDAGAHQTTQGTRSSLSFGRRLSQALLPTLPKAPVLFATETVWNENREYVPSGPTFDSVFRLTVEADELASDEEVNTEHQIVEERDDRTKRWSAIVEQDEREHKRRGGRNRHKQRSSSQRDRSRSRSKRRRTQDVELAVDLEVATLSDLTGVPTSSPFGRLAAANLTTGIDDEEVTIDHTLNRTLSALPQETIEQSRAVPVGDGFDALDVMADYLFRFGCEKKKWFKKPPVTARARQRTGSHVTTGVCIRAKTGVQRTYPLNLPGLLPFEMAVTALNPEVAFKIRSPIVKTIMATCITPDMAEFTIDANTRIQILDKLPHLARARKHQYAAFVRDEGVLCVWADTVETIITATETLERSLIDYVWHQENVSKKHGFAAHLEAHAQQEKDALLHATTKGEQALEEGVEAKPDLDLDAEDYSNIHAKQQWKDRPVMFYDACSTGITAIIVLALLALGWRVLIKEILLDGKAIRLLLIATSPVIAAVAMWQILGPIRQVHQNSAYYSAIAPKRTTGELPHVTVWVPVYKEDLEEVIMPTIESLKAAQSVYERQGGSVSILVCDDGLQLISPNDVQARKNFYYDNSMAFVARPGHGVDGFERRGRFKKASNMNFAIQLSLRVEEIMDDLRPNAHEQKGGVTHFWHEADELDLYETALVMAQEETEGRAWAAGNIRIGSYILIIDSDTRVPEDCFADAVSEFEQSPEVAVIQHSSGVMQVANHFFENGIAYFTRSIQLAISFCCANGSTAPFVGHNAFLRWSALQEIMFEEDGVKKIWSESHVSEDFALSLALQLKGYVMRWATYSDDKFEEGVSLTCDDEVNRWQKYAWGCSELIFRPLRYWLLRGPFTPLFRQYIFSNIPLNCKISVLSYIFSYYAIACAWPLTALNYVLIGFGVPIDQFYLSGWQVTFVCICLFTGLSNLASIVLRYRLKVKNTGEFATRSIIYIPFFFIFYSGLSMQISSALICHMVGYQMTWAATLKTVEVSNFFKEVPAILRKFKITLPLNFMVVIGMIITTSSIMPADWRVTSIEAIVPMALMTAGHILYPIALNPWLMHFSF